MLPVGKGDTLEFIRERHPEIPIPEFERCRRDEFLTGLRNFKWRTAGALARSIGYPVIVRSDGNEDGLGKSMAGLYHSEVAENAMSLNGVLNRVRSRYDERFMEGYCRNRGFEVPESPIDVFFQRYVPSREELIVSSHPHLDGALIVDLSFLYDNALPHRFNQTVIGDDFEEMIDFYLETTNSNQKSGRELEYGIKRALGDFRLVEADFEDEVSYQAEIGLFPYSFRQFRPFRKKQFANFRVNDLDIDYDDERNLSVSQVIGVTSSEGIELPFFISTQESHMQGYAHDIWGKYVLSELNQFESYVTDYEYGIGVRSMPLYAPFIDSFMQKIPKVIFADTIYTLSRNFPWQFHECFRLLERAENVASVPYLGYMEKFRYILPAYFRYYSDGVRGAIEFKH